jgi:hypothetical protein
VFNPDFSPTGYRARVVSALGNGARWKLVLDAPVPVFKFLDADMIIVNWRWSARNVIIRRFKVANNRARAILVQVSNFVIEQSYFENIQQSAIKVRTDGLGPEGSGIANVLIANNTFIQTDVNALKGQGTINVITSDKLGGISGYKANKFISIVGNVLRNQPQRAMVMSGVNGLVIRDNTIINDRVDNPASQNRGMIFVGLSEDVVIAGNQWFSTLSYDSTGQPLASTQASVAKNMVLLDSQTVTNVTLNGNAVEGQVRGTSSGTLSMDISDR